MKKQTGIANTPKKTAAKALREITEEKVKTPEQAAEATGKELAKYGIEAKEEFKIIDPITKEERTVSLSRTGTQESDLIIALADSNTTRDQKDHALAMYFWGRGSESVSMMVDLMRYKGSHTKETRIFKSQMRFDFESLVNSLVDHFETQARNTGDILCIDLKKEIQEYGQWLKSTNDAVKLYSAFYEHKKGSPLDRTDLLECAQISQAIYQLDEAEKLTKARTNIAQAREREKGGGIYIDNSGRPWDATMPEVDEIIKADRAATAEIEHE